MKKLSMLLATVVLFASLSFASTTPVKEQKQLEKQELTKAKITADQLKKMIDETPGITNEKKAEAKKVVDCAFTGVVFTSCGWVVSVEGYVWGNCILGLVGVTLAIEELFCGGYEF